MQSFFYKVIRSTYLLIFLAITIYFFDQAFNFYYTYKVKVANQPEIYGPLGDFFGGILNPLLAFVNIIVLIFITYLVATNEKKRHRSQLRYEAYISFKEKMPPHVQDSTANMTNVHDTYKEIIRQLNLFKDYSIFLFDDHGWKLRNKIDALKENIEQQMELANFLKSMSEIPQEYIDIFNQREFDIDMNRTVVLFEMQMQILN